MTEKLVKAEKLSKCDKSITGNHYWVKLQGNDPVIASLGICIYCGLVDDRPLNNIAKEEK